MIWLFSPLFDFFCFGAPVLAALAIVLVLSGGPLGLGAPLSPLLFLISVVLVDVAHVYATAYRLYPAELRRRPLLYAGAPLFCYAASVLAYAASPLTFWRCMAYLAVVHFVRQQYGWVKLAGRREGAGRADRILDGAAVYAGTCYPILWWHAHLPRRFHWFVSGDFARFIPPEILLVARPLWVAIGVLWVLRQVQRGLRGQGVSAAKGLIMVGTWVTWYMGIIYWDSDVAFTLTNVLAHGIPYILVVHRFDGRRRGRPPGVWSFLLFCLPLLLIAYLEEAAWDRLVWHDHPMLFPGPAVELAPPVLLFLVPLLSLPQSAHYILDAWLWRGGQNPDLKRYLS